MRVHFIVIFTVVLSSVVMCGHRNHAIKKGHKHHVTFKPKHVLRKHKQTRQIETLEVETKSGRLEGTLTETFSGTKYYKFLGVPFAQKPVGTLRFEPPQPIQWNDTWDATYERNVCIQADTNLNVSGSEDCLYLNIYTPSSPKSPSPLLPVMVWIHGGGFSYGDGHYNTSPPDGFINNGVLVVTVSYRLNIFGFLSTEDEVVPGNMGLKDQRMALQWIQDNIKNFGGDPKQVTIMGQSAGAASVTYLIQSPSAKGLFQQAIIHSGSSLSPWSLSRRARSAVLLLGAKYQIFNNDTKAIVKRLKTENASTIAITAQLITNLYLFLDPLNGFIFDPVVEVSNPTIFFSAKSFEQLNSCNLVTVPIIFGYNSLEGAAFKPVLNTTDEMSLLWLYLLRYDLVPDSLVPIDMNIKNNTVRHSVGVQIKNFYTGNRPLITSSTATVKYTSDNWFLRPCDAYVKLYSNCKQPVYAYRFSYTGNRTLEGVPHTFELQFFFYNTIFKNENDRDVSETVMDLWTSFIKNGIPSTNRSEITWISATNINGYSYLDIGNELTIQNQDTNPDKEYLANWYSWYDTYGHRPYDTF